MSGRMKLGSLGWSCLCLRREHSGRGERLLRNWKLVRMKETDRKEKVDCQERPSPSRSLRSFGSTVLPSPLLLSGRSPQVSGLVSSMMTMMMTKRRRTCLSVEKEKGEEGLKNLMIQRGNEEMKTPHYRRHCHRRNRQGPGNTGS